MADDIRERLFEMQDSDYAEFQRKLIPNIAPDTVIGVRTPLLRKLAKELKKDGDCAGFLAALPHKYFDENQLHAFIISEEKDFEKCICEVERFLPYIDNWATCDQLSPKVFKKHTAELLPYIDKWLLSAHTYTVRYAIGVLMQYYLDDKFNARYADKVAAVTSEEYYINMMIAWYFATALAKQYDSAVKYIQEKRLGKQAHNKAIQKAVESYRVSPEHKEYLKTLKR